MVLRKLPAGPPCANDHASTTPTRRYMFFFASYKQVRKHAQINLRSCFPIITLCLSAQRTYLPIALGYKELHPGGPIKTPESSIQAFTSNLKKLSLKTTDIHGPLTLPLVVCKLNRNPFVGLEPFPKKLPTSVHPNRASSHIYEAQLLCVDPPLNFSENFQQSFSTVEKKEREIESVRHQVNPSRRVFLFCYAFFF